MAERELLPGTVLLVDALEARTAELFEAPLRIITCHDLKEVPAALDAVDAARASGAHVAGYLAYELGYAFEPKLADVWSGNGDPLLWFGVYDRVTTISLPEARSLLRGCSQDQQSSVGLTGFDMTRQQYEAAFAKVQGHLAKGEIYQVNLTIRGKISHGNNPERLFLDLLQRQPVAHAAFVKTQDRAILSVSPELFLERSGKMLVTRPMKGTAGRGRTNAEDRAIARALSTDPKQRAENTMIVDLMRNDLSRICEPGSVKVRSLCEVERYRTVHQMTSTIEGVLEEGVHFPKIIERLFPCGSITGAPKLSAMQIARRLETSPRGVYTGSIGAMKPSGDFRFNVAIRTLDLKTDGTGVAGTGSGVVFDSGAGPEFDECALKLKFLSADMPEVQLIETLLYRPDEGLALLERHMARLQASADYFGYPVEEKDVREQLRVHVSEATGPRRVRLLLDADGGVNITSVPLTEDQSPALWKVCIADQNVSSSDPYLFHKTTVRQFYDRTREKMAGEFGCQEVLFLNENGHVTEGSFTNVFIERDGRLLTPALEHGLLPGTFREALLDNRLAFEADLTLRDLETADALYVGNSVRGLVRAELIATKALKAAS
ncbi:aminodeoxychorismate synthase component I [Roseibium sediminis]|uniref:aminodeoxychorismate synthase component I n=1 Tax=Roseibium sediminis TaxID=1775174 RepID=UPI00123CB9A7|nr:aminodeoxychorismate synthase component I [Roseibium sediminis]